MFKASTCCRIVLCASAALLSSSTTGWSAVDPALRDHKAVTGTPNEIRTELEVAWSKCGNDSLRIDAHFQDVRARAHQTPKDTDVVRHYVTVARSTQRLDQVMKELEDYAEANPKSPHAHYYLGLADPENAKGHFENALKHDRDFYEALVAQAGVELVSPEGDMAKAKTSLLHAIQQQPDQALGYIVLEQLYRRTGDVDSQGQALALAAEADPWDRRIRQMYLRQLQTQGQAKAAESPEALNQWVREVSTQLLRLAKLGDGSPELALSAARLWTTQEDHVDPLFESLNLAADLGMVDYKGLEQDRTLGPILEYHKLGPPIVEKIKQNREDRSEQLKINLLEELVSAEVPELPPIPLLGGGELDLKAKTGRVVILDFWATWCGPCRRTLPVLAEFYQGKDAEVEVYCVNVFERDGGGSVEPFWEASGYPMPVALGTEQWARVFNVQSIPALYVIGPDGNVRYHHKGFTPYLSEHLGWISEGLLSGS